MKINQKVTKVKLKVEQNNDYVLLGLVSAEPDYKLSFSLNKKFRISLKNIDYLLQIQISEKEADLNSITLKLREIDSVTAVFNIDLDTIKDKNLHYLTQ